MEWLARPSVADGGADALCLRQTNKPTRDRLNGIECTRLLAASVERSCHTAYSQHSEHPHGRATRRAHQHGAL
jgi:hypothetical protein